MGEQIEPADIGTVVDDFLATSDTGEFPAVELTKGLVGDISASADDPVEIIRDVAGEAVMRANTDPRSLSAEQHEAVDALQAEATRLVVEANLKLTLN